MLESSPLNIKTLNITNSEPRSYISEISDEEWREILTAIEKSFNNLVGAVPMYLRSLSSIHIIDQTKVPALSIKALNAVDKECNKNSVMNMIESVSNLLVFVPKIAEKIVSSESWYTIQAEANLPHIADPFYKRQFRASTTLMLGRRPTPDLSNLKADLTYNFPKLPTKFDRVEDNALGFRLLHPFSKGRIHQKQQLEIRAKLFKANKLWPQFLIQVATHQILSADEVKVTEKGLELVNNNNFNNTPNLPERRAF